MSADEALVARIEALEAEVEELKRQKKGGRPGKKIQVSIHGICGIDPERDSATCPDAGIYRRQQGCKGTACMEASSQYYARYRSNKEEQ